MSGTTSEKEKLALQQVLQRSQNAVDEIERRLHSLKRQLLEKKAEIPSLEKELSACKRVCQEEEERARLEVERLTPKNYVFVPDSMPNSIDSNFADAFYRSWKQSDKAFLTLDIPQSVRDTMMQFFPISSGEHEDGIAMANVECILLSFTM